jgi:hypothetical protein
VTLEKYTGKLSVVKIKGTKGYSRRTKGRMVPTVKISAFNNRKLMGI